MQHALELLEDAQLLLEHGRRARAHALATLAVEEIGKGWIFDQRFRGEGQRAFKVSRDHEEKLIAARQMIALVTSISESNVINADKWFSEELEYVAEEDFFIRMAHLYVEVDGGQVVGGSDGVTRERAEGTLAFANRVVHVGIHMLSERDLDGTAHGSDE